MLEREIKITQDGSPTLYIPEWNESYHSKHGALQEALHVFIKHGWDKFKDLEQVYILEYGFGTGLNSLITLLFAEEQKIETHYHSIEKFPITSQEIEKLPIPKQLSQYLNIEDTSKIDALYKAIHSAPWEETTAISSHFYLKKIKADFKTIELEANEYNMIYFDAFGMRVQPELWTENIFKKAYNFLKQDGLLTTYACNGATKRALKEVGFNVEKIPGPPGKREMINAWKK